MANKQTNAQAEFTPQTSQLYNQKRIILDIIEERGSLSNWEAINDPRLHCTKLSTRISEIESRSGKEFKRTRCYNLDENGKPYFIGLRYSIQEGLTIEDYR